LAIDSRTKLASRLAAIALVAIGAFGGWYWIRAHRIGDTVNHSLARSLNMRTAERSQASKVNTPESGRKSHGLPSARSAIGIRCESSYFQPWQEPAEKVCQFNFSHGLPLPDARCTPGGVNPSFGVAALKDKNWTTRWIRNCETNETEKEVTYSWYNTLKPLINKGRNQTCELDHLVPLELGGADGLGNIWPQCGPEGTALTERYFKLKDEVEDYLVTEVKAGRLQLREAQEGIARDSTQYLPQATQRISAPSNPRKGHKRRGDLKPVN